MFTIELVLPFLIFTTRRLRFFAGFAFIFFQLLIFATGNYTFFNLLAMALVIPLFDDVAKIKSLKAIDRTVDGLNELYGKHTLHLGTTLWLGKHRQHLTQRGDLPDRKMRLLKGETFRQRLHIPMWRIPI